MPDRVRQDDAVIRSEAKDLAHIAFLSILQGRWRSDGARVDGNQIPRVQKKSGAKHTVFR